MAILSKIKSHSDVKNIDQIAEQLSVIKTDQAFKGYAMSYKVEIIEKKIQLYNQKQVNEVLKICLVIFQMN